MNADVFDDYYTGENFQRSFEHLKSVIAKLDDRGIDYILIGGWAMRAYDSPIGSVDIDLLIHERYEEDLEEIISTMKQDQKSDTIVDYEIFEGKNELWSAGPIGYIPADLLENAIEKVELKYGETCIRANVPSIEMLFFMKLKAYRDRNLQYDCKTVFREYQKLDVYWQREIDRFPEQYLLRKAGKDLADLSLLLANDFFIPSFREKVREHDFMDVVVKWHCRNFNSTVLQFATDLLSEHGIQAGIRKQFESFFREYSEIHLPE